MTIHETTCRTALHRLKRKFPYAYDLNIYRGCSHACAYCYAIGTHYYLNNDNYFDEITVKTNIVELLERELTHPSWDRQVINIGGITDSYQPCEKQYKLMPEILKLLIKTKTPCVISTKSDLILRDFDLIEKLASLTYVNIACSITCMDDHMRKKIEPYSASSKKRFEVLKTFSKTNASTGVHFMPIIPYITDTHHNIDSLFKYANKSDVDYVLAGILYLKGKTKTAFFEHMHTHFPDHCALLENLYRAGSVSKEYKDWIYRRIQPLLQKYDLSTDYLKPLKEKLKEMQ